MISNLFTRPVLLIHIIFVITLLFLGVFTSTVQAETPIILPINLTADDGLGGAPVTPEGTITYTITFDNPNTFDVHNIAFSASALPSEVQIISASHGGYTIYRWGLTMWSIETLPAGGSQSVTLTVGLEPWIGVGNNIEFNMWINSIANHNDEHIDVVPESVSLSTPVAGPVYPNPELPTIVLFSTGLLGIIGYLGFRRSRNIKGHTI